MKLSDLEPFPVFIAWEGQPVELKPFCLRSIVWAERFFFDGKTDGFDRMNQILAGAEGQEVLFNTLIDIVYYLGESDFSGLGIKTPVELKLKIGESEKKLEIIGKFKDALEQVIAQSFPDPKKEDPKPQGGSIYEALRNQHKKQVTADKPNNWDQIYIAFFRAGGMSINEFMSLTMRQINPLLAEIQYKHNEDMNLLSELIHKKIKIKKPHRILPEMDFSEEDINGFERIHEKLVKEARIN
jgi:hypothetical protein